MPVEKSAGAVVFHRDGGKIKYLLLRNSANKSWGFPKGLIDKDEKIEEAALREVREEAGISDLKLLEGFKETIRYFMKVKYDYQIQLGMKLGETVLKFVTYFLAEAKTKEIKLSFEHDQYQWLDMAQAHEALVMKENATVLVKADQFLANSVQNDK